MPRSPYSSCWTECAPPYKGPIAPVPGTVPAPHPCFAFAALRLTLAALAVQFVMDGLKAAFFTG